MCMEEFHEITLQQQEHLSWADKFKDQIIMWIRRRRHVLTGIPYNNEVPPDRTYIAWYWQYFRDHLCISKHGLLMNPTMLNNVLANRPNYPPTPHLLE